MWSIEASSHLVSMVTITNGETEWVLEEAGNGEAEELIATVVLEMLVNAFQEKGHRTVLSNPFGVADSSHANIAVNK